MASLLYSAPLAPPNFSLSMCTINYANTPPNILEYYSNCLKGYSNFMEAGKEFNIKTYNTFIREIPSDTVSHFKPFTSSFSTGKINLLFISYGW